MKKKDAVLPSPVDFTTVTPEGVFSGYAALFNTPDEAGEVFAPGAFRETLETRGAAGVRMLWQHEVEKPLGVWTEMREDEYGLFVRGKLVLETELAREVQALMQAGALNGLSIGFQPISRTGNTVTEADLWEISVVTFARQPNAKVDGRSVTMSDAAVVDAGSLRRTGDGYLVANVRCARTGIQLYHGSECGRPDMDIVRVYRPESEVFHKDTLKSFAHRPVTVGHPENGVCADNWKDHGVGQTGDEVARDKEFVRVPLILMDADAIRAVESGVRELSMGYTTDLKWERGTTPKGEAYDAVQTMIRGNHLAIVSAARGGSSLRLGDRKEKVMNEKVMVDELEVEVSDSKSAAILKRGLESLKSKIQTLEKKLEEEEEKAKKKDEAISKKDEELKAKDAEVATMKSQLDEEKQKNSPAALETMAKDRAELIGKARAVIGDKLVVQGKSNTEIRAQVVSAKVGDVAKSWDEKQIEASFNTLTADVKPDGTGTTTYDLASALGGSTNVEDERDKAHTQMCQDLENRWRNPYPAGKAA